MEKKYIFFWLDTQENGVFSNWYERPFVIDDFQYFSVEQYFMAQKAKCFHDAERYTKILRAKNSEECMLLGREVTPFDPIRWDAVKYDVMKEANREKFWQNPDLLECLMNTGDSILAEASPRDRIWGIGLDAATAAHTPQEAWQGENLAGKILMELRANACR